MAETGTDDRAIQSVGSGSFTTDAFGTCSAQRSDAKGGQSRHFAPRNNGEPFRRQTNVNPSQTPP